MRARVIRLLASPRLPWIAAAVGVLLCLPAVPSGLVGDDHLWWLILQRSSPVGQGLPPLLHLYNFIPGGLATEVLQGCGLLTWWADPEISIALMRPLAAATHVLDHAVAPRNFVLQHLHSLGWYAASVLVVGWIYRRIHPRAAALAGLATLLFAVEDAHAMNASWLANRHALISMVLGGLALLAHLRWRDGGRTRWLLAALLALAVGLAAGESTLGAAAYLVAWQLTLDRTRWSRRLLAIAPYAALVIGWRALYDHLGYGVVGSSLYVDPGQDPWAFALALLTRWPLLQFGQWLQAPVDVVMFSTDGIRAAVIAVAFVACAALTWFFLPLLRRSAEARFWAAGMALGLVPLCAAFPMDRLLAFAGVGAFGLLALQVQAMGWLGSAPDGDGPRASPGRFSRWATAGLLVLHLPLAGATMLVRTATLPVFGQFFAAGANTAPADPGIEDQVFLFVSGHEFPTAYTQLVRWTEGRPAPRRVALLASLASDNHVTREDRHTLLIEPADGYLHAYSDRLEVSVGRRFEVGYRAAMPDFVAEVRAVTDDGRPARVAFHFERPLDDPSYCWLGWGEQGAEPFELPAIGATAVVPAPGIGALFPGPAAE